MSGFVSLVGAGPGDPGLLTLAGRDRLSQAEVVVYDRLIAQELLDYAPYDAERIFAGKSPQSKALSQDEINALLVERGLRGQRVVRLKGGDPFVFGRGGEEALALVAAGVPFEVVPGVTSAVAAPAYAGVPVTHRGLASSFAVVTGHEDDEKDESSIDWAGLAKAVDTLVVLMGAAALEGVSKRLIAAGRPADTPAVSVEWGTTTEQRSVASTLAGISQAVRDAKLATPLLTVIGPSAALHERLNWFEGRPLFGRRVLVTRARHQASALADLLRREGASPIELPTIELAPVAGDAELIVMIGRIEAREYAWCLLTSTNAVEWLCAAVVQRGHDARLFAAGCKLAALGTATAEALKQRGIIANLTAGEFTSDGLLEAMPVDLQGARVLLPRGDGASPGLVSGIRERGGIVDEVVLYESRAPSEPDAEALRRLREGRIDVVTFASSSSVRNLKALLGPDFDRLRDVTVACIGPVTAATARELGLTVAVEPATHTIPALVAALKDHLIKKKRRRVPDGPHDWTTGAPQYIRALALVLVRRDDGAILAAPGFDRVKQQRFYRPLGGGIEFGERAEDAARRELQEELSAELTDLRLPGLFENLFTYQGQQGHELIWLYEARFTDKSLYERDVVIADESGSKFEVHWVPVETFLRGEAPLYPDGLLALLQS